MVNRNRIGDGGKRSNRIGREGICDVIGRSERWCDLWWVIQSAGVINGGMSDRRLTRSIASQVLRWTDQNVPYKSCDCDLKFYIIKFYYMIGGEGKKGKWLKGRGLYIMELFIMKSNGSWRGSGFNNKITYIFLRSNL